MNITPSPAEVQRPPGDTDLSSWDGPPETRTFLLTPGPQPHNRIAGTFGAQLARSLFGPPVPARPASEQRLRRLLRRLIREARLLRREVEELSAVVVCLESGRARP